MEVRSLPPEPNIEAGKRPSSQRDGRMPGVDGVDGVAVRWTDDTG
jgi:hypothetical protein